VLEMLKDIAKAGTTVVMVTHSVAHAAHAGRVIKLLDGQVVPSIQQLAA
jgi:putative ABC transport system ATP-binding protein